MDPELTRQLINIAILVAGVLAIIWVLRDFFKLASRVIRIVVLVMVMLVILGNILGIIDLPRF
ncbi:MAG TPA: hypothetical protein PLY06_00740 [Anaerolineaceae bacterium]|nr:hypothetical protein [Anaerolineaceae bacterium]